MTQSIERGALRAFFLPYANEAHLADERVHILRGRNRHGSGYICEVREHDVGKYTDGSNSITWLAYAEIDAVEVRDFNGTLLQSFAVTD